MLALTLALLVSANPENVPAARAPSPVETPSAAPAETLVPPPLTSAVVPFEPSRRGKDRLSKTERAAKLLTPEEHEELARLGAALDENGRPAGSKLMLGMSIATITAGLIVPTAMFAAGVVVSVVVGLFGLVELLVGSATIFRFLGNLWVEAFAMIPVWGWVLMAATTVVGVGVLVAAEVGDGPRRLEGRALKRQRDAIINTALAREQPATVPVLTF